MKHKLRLTITFVLLLLAKPLSLMAYDEAGHHAIVYAMARNMGYTVKEAALIADASQSLDDHDVTTAFSWSKVITDYAGTNWNVPLNEKPYIINGQVYHALTNPENRSLIEQLHINRINNIQSSNLPPDEKRKLSLIYMGQYLHFVADEVVHPASTTITGHAVENIANSFVSGIGPDLPESDPNKLKRMMLTMQDRLADFRDNALSAPTDWKKVDEKFNDPNEWSDNMQKVQDAVVNCWKPSMLEQAKGYVYNVDLDREKEERIIKNLRDELENMYLPGGENGELPNHIVIPLDINGDPPGAPHNIDDLGFYYYVSTLGALKSERAITARSELEAHVNRLKKLLQSIGGIALDPDLKFEGKIGKPKRVTINERGLVLVTSNGEYVIPGINLQSFATILRTVAAGEIPYISIGTEPSGRSQFAKVTYAPSLRGTREGNMLFRADVQFKALFMNFPFGYDYKLNKPGDPLFYGFPGRGGEALRFWIASDGIVLRKDDSGYLKVLRTGMQILSETYLQNQSTNDPVMNAYTKHLTENWDAITLYLPEFKNIEDLALITSLVSWIRKNRVEIDEVFWTIPTKGGYTPDHTPYVLNKNKEYPVESCGGITLMPEFKNKGLAYDIQTRIFKKINDFEYRYGKGWGRIIFCFVSLFTLFLSVIIPTFIFWALANWVLKRSDKRMTFRVALKNTAILMAITSVLSFLAAPLVFNRNLPDLIRNYWRCFLQYLFHRLYFLSGQDTGASV